MFDEPLDDPSGHTVHHTALTSDYLTNRASLQHNVPGTHINVLNNNVPSEHSKEALKSDSNSLQTTVEHKPPNTHRPATVHNPGYIARSNSASDHGESLGLHSSGQSLGPSGSGHSIGPQGQKAASDEVVDTRSWDDMTNSSRHPSRDSVSSSGATYNKHVKDNKILYSTKTKPQRTKSQEHLPTWKQRAKSPIGTY